MQGGVTQQHLQPFLRKMPTTLQSAWEVWVKEVKPYEELRQQKRIRRECPSAVCCMLFCMSFMLAGIAPVTRTFTTCCCSVPDHLCTEEEEQQVHDFV